MSEFVASIAARLLSQRQSSESFESVEIHGSQEFISRTRQALALLVRTPFFNVIPRYVRVIRQGKRSGMRAAAARPTFVVGRQTWNHSALWYAGSIAHDCHHSKLYHDALECTGEKPDADSWTGTDAEKKCLKFQIEVMESMGADDATLSYLKQAEKNPTYQGRNRGWLAWWDYWKRRW